MVYQHPSVLFPRYHNQMQSYMYLGKHEQRLCADFYLSVYVVYLRKNWDDLEIRTEIFVYVMSFPEYEYSVFGMLSSWAHERLDGLYSYSVFKDLSVIGQCLMNVLAPNS